MQLSRIDLNFISFKLTAKGVDLDDPLDAAKLEGDLPIEHGSQFAQRVLETRFGSDLKLIDFAHPCSDRTELRSSHPRRYVLPGPLQSLVDLIPGPIDVGSIMKSDRHGAQAESANRSNLVDVGDPTHRIFNRECDELLDFFGSQSWRICQHLDLDIRQVWNRIERNLSRSDQAHSQDQQRSDQNDESIVQGPMDDTLNHHDYSSPKSSASIFDFRTKAPWTTT